MKWRRVAVVSLLSCAVFYSVLRLAPVPALLDPQASSRVLFDADEQLLNVSLSRDEKYRVYCSLNEISPALIRATLEYEDRYFFQHFGVNPYSLVKGAIATAFHSKRPIGGSTISMQLARLRLGLQTRSVFGKLRQLFWALALEAQYSKQEILQAYLNLAPYGGNVEGVAAASLVYFRKPAKELSLAESVSLAVIPQHPSFRGRDRGRASLEAARSRLLVRLKEDIRPQELRFRVADIPTDAPHFLSRSIAGNSETLEFRSEIQKELQAEAERVLESNLARFQEFGVTNGTILVAELPDMAVRAYVGSAGYVNERISGYVNGLSARRSPGSVLKPFVYALALEQGKLIPETTLYDVPIRLASFKPENFERNFLGPISATDALVRSRNIPSLEVFRMLQPETFYHFLQAGGVEGLLPEDHYGIALVLGGLGVTAEEIAQLYGIIGNGGTLAKLRFLRSEKYASGERLLSPEASYLVRDMLSNNPAALGRFREQHIPWKTGTSYGSKDAWAAGIAGKYIIVSWLGNFDGKPNANLSGRDFAGPVLFSMIDRLSNIARLSPAPQPITKLNLKKVEVCALTGELPGESCPHRKKSWFIPGTSPISTCSVHKRIQVDPDSGLRMCPGRNGAPRVFEVWSSETQELFRRAGLKRNSPPAYSPECALSTSQPEKMRIISPEEHLQYYLEAHRELELEFLAAVPGEARIVSWFVDDQPIAQVAPRESVYWKAKIGSFQVRAVDDLGRSSMVRIRILPAV